MRKIKLANDTNVPGWGRIAKDTAFKVQRFNERYVYVELKPGIVLQLSRKRECVVVY